MRERENRRTERERERERERREEASEFQSERRVRERKKETRFGFVRVSLPKRPSFRLGQKVQNGVMLCCMLSF